MTKKIRIKTERLIIRSLEAKDAKRLQEIANNKKIWENLTDTFPHPYTLENAKNWIKINQEKEKTNNFAITIKDEIIGMIGFEKQKNFYETGYWIAEQHWGKGYATESLNAITQHIFSNYETKKIRAKVFIHNPASGKVLEKCGYKKQQKIINTIKAGKPIKELIYIKKKIRTEKPF